MKKHIIEMNESRQMMETLTVKIRGEILTAESVIDRGVSTVFSQPRCSSPI